VWFGFPLSAFAAGFTIYGIGMLALGFRTYARLKDDPS
jgi:hypothetical protein